MKPEVLDQVEIESFMADNIVAFADMTGRRLKDSGVSMADVLKSLHDSADLLAHLTNSDVHLTKEFKEVLSLLVLEAQAHMDNDDIHLSQQDRTNWDSKETPEGAQFKANMVQSNLNNHVNNKTVHITSNERVNWNNKFTKEEILNMFSQFEYGNDWKEAVQTFSDLDRVYPNAFDGWTVNVLDNDITYRFDGVEWIPISANAIPLATEEVSGKMSFDDKRKINHIEENANHYVHPTDDNSQHVSFDKMKYWDLKASTDLVTILTNGLMSAEDKKKLDTVAYGATNYEEPEFFPATKITEDEYHRFLTDEQIVFFSEKASTELASMNNSGLMSKSDFVKLSQIEDKANNYIHPEKHSANMIEENNDKMFVTKDQINKWTSGYATPLEAGIMSKEDKTKLDTVAMNANNYVHPTNHSPAIISQDKDNRFVTDDQIENWDGKKNDRDFVMGSGILNSTTGTVINHPFKNTSYNMTITLTSRPSGDVGEIWVEKYNDKSIVFCTGTNTTCTFDYTMIKWSGI